MVIPAEPDPVKLFVAVLWRDPSSLDRALSRLDGLWGGVDISGPDRPFEITSYYEEEMGRGLLRRIVGFRPLIAPDSIIRAKREAAQVEEDLRGPTGRLVNLDVGYLDIHKVVLASWKPGPQKIYLGQGVYADFVCRYSRGSFHSFEWTFPDFRDGRYDAELLALRARYKTQMRE